MMVKSNTKEEAIDKQPAKLDEKLHKMEKQMADMEEAIKNWERRKSIDENNQEEQRFERRIRGEKQIEEMRQGLQKSSRIRREDNKKDRKCKLPKLVISQFSGTHIDQFRFWNQFQTQIDKSELSPVTTLRYLKKMVIPKVRLLIEGLPWNTEGYERAKNILSSKFGKPSELANAHIQNILSLPVIAGTNPVRINEFYEKLMTSVQSLDTMGKLTEINGCIRSTTDKLLGISTDLVTIDSDWDNWDFGKLVEQLEQWSDRNPISFEKKPPEHEKRKSVYQARQLDSKLKSCVYCNKADHKSTNCNSVTSINERRKFLSG